MGIRRLFRDSEEANRQPPRDTDPFAREVLDTNLEMASALTFGVRSGASQSEIIAHSARVAVVVRQLGEGLGLDPGEIGGLVLAARLHELGMISVPIDILERPGPLADHELQLVRDQARIGAEIIGRSYAEPVGWVVRTQYTDHAELQRRLPDDPARILLAGIFRVADILVTTRYPRPYQRPLDSSMQASVLAAGTGTRYHPRVVSAAIDVDISLN